MKKLAMLLITAAMLVSITACTNNAASLSSENSRPNRGTSSSQGNNKPNGGISPNQGNNNPNSSSSPNLGNHPNGASSNQGNRQPGANQLADSSYSIDDLIERVKQAGCISGNPQTLDAKALGAVKAVAYGNVVFLDYEYTNSQDYLDAYEANKVMVNGREAKIGALNGPYVMAFFDGNVDQNAVKAFHSLGF